MISFEEAQERILQIPCRKKITTKNIVQCLHAISAEDCKCLLPQPHWDNSAMDGYALRSQDLLQPRKIVEEIPAGIWPSKTIQEGECARIFTGAPIPKGADTVLIQENALIVDGYVQPTQSPVKLENIRVAGEEHQVGDLFLSQGDVINVGHIAIASSQGYQKLSVYDPLRIGILATGDELVSENRSLQGAEIYASNTNILMSLIQDCGHIPVNLGIAKDSKTSIMERMTQAQQDCDVILTSGGVSVGKYDLVQQVLQDMGMELDFWKVRMKPGKPIVFGMLHQKPFFGLPGNPVSCTVVFLTLLRPWLLKNLGNSPQNLFLPQIRAILDEDLQKNHGRAEFFRMKIHKKNNAYHTTRTGSQSSAWMSSIAEGDGLFYVNHIANQSIPKGTIVDIFLFPWKTNMVFQK